MLTDEQSRRLLAIYPPLARVGAELRENALRDARVATLPAGTTIFRESEPCQAFPFLLSGRVRVFKSSASGRELPLYRVEPGDACVVTSGCLLGNQAYNACGVAEQPSELVLMPDADFDRLLTDLAFRNYVFGLFAERMQELMQVIDEVAFRKLDARLANRLLGHGGELRITHQQLADELGSVREIVTRLLKGFADVGLVELGRERIAIRDAAGLRRIAGG